MKEVVPLASDPFMWKRSIRSFRHLECQNPSIISESIGIPNGSKKWEKSEEEEWRNGTKNLIHMEEDMQLECIVLLL